MEIKTIQHRRQETAQQQLEKNMSDKAWLLNPKAIAAAKVCIKVVESELGVKLKLSHPQFTELLYEYCELTESVPLQKAFHILLSMAGEGIRKSLQASHQNDSLPENVIKAFIHKDFVPAERAEASENFPTAQEMIDYQGRKYPRWKEDKEFKGFYRGQASYR